MLEEDIKPVLVVGATFFGLGLAAAAGRKAKVIERSILVGHEFICTYKPGVDWNRERVCEKSALLQKEFVERKIVGADGKVHIPGMQPVLYHSIRRENLNVHFATELLNVVKAGTSYEVTLFNASGMVTERYQSIVDTTDKCLSFPRKEVPVIGKSINALIHSTQGMTLPAQCEGGEALEFLQGNCKGEVVMRYPVEKEDGIATAREKLHRFWQNRPDFLRDWSLDAIALECETTLGADSEKISENWWWYPSSVYRNPVEAFEKGFEAGMLYADTGNKPTNDR